MESVASAAQDRHEVESGHLRERLVVRVIRLDDDDVVALVRAGEEREEDGLAAAGRREDLVVLEAHSDAALVIALQRADELRCAGRR